MRKLALLALIILPSCADMARQQALKDADKYCASKHEKASDQYFACLRKFEKFHNDMAVMQQAQQQQRQQEMYNKLNNPMTIMGLQMMSGAYQQPQPQPQPQYIYQAPTHMSCKTINLGGGMVRTDCN